MLVYKDFISYIFGNISAINTEMTSEKSFHKQNFALNKLFILTPYD